MIYILTLLAIFVCVVNYDILGNSKDKNVLYNILLIWFIAVSGFAYNVGADVPGYMYEYDEYSWSKIHSWGDLLEFRHRQPGWVIVNLMCHAVSDNFLFFKLVEAIFVNYVIFRFIKKYCPFIFVGLLFYAVMLYLNLNFNALRQAYSLAFFLIGFDYMVQKKWLKYYLFALFAFMFHSSALILFVIPFLSLVKIDLKNTMIIGVLVLVALFAFEKSFLNSIEDLFFGLALSSDDLLEEYGELGNKFLREDYAAQEANIFGYIEIFFRFSLGTVAVLYNNKFRKDIPQFVGVLTMLFLIFRVLETYIPILFFRLIFYVELFYIVTLSVFIVDVCQRFVSKKNILIPLLALMLFCYTPIKSLQATNPRSGMTDMEQFYPYYSVFNPKTYPPRASTFGWHK